MLAEEADAGAEDSLLLPESFDGDEEEPSFWSKLDLSGYLKNETAYRFREPRSITKIRNIAYLDARYPFSSNFKFTFTGWHYHDLAYALYDYETIAARSERNAEEPLVFVENLEHRKDTPVTEARELYVDLFVPNTDIRIGKQFVIWGVLEGVRIVDEINPIDFRELILLDLLDYRIPLWTLKVDHYGENTDYEFIWIPDIKFHKPGPPGSEWELLQEVPNTVFPETWEIKNSEVGIRVTKMLFDTEFSFSYLYTWDDFPVIFRTVRLDQTEEPIFFPTYTRISMYGMTFVKQVKGTILKGEFAYVTDKYFGLDNTVDRDNDGYIDSNGESQSDHIRWGLGVDLNIWGADLSPGLTQWVILDYDSAMIQDEFDTSFNLFARKEFPQKSALFEFLLIYLVNLNEFLVKPEVTFQITDRFQLATGLDLFFGEKSQLGVGSSGTAIGNVSAIEQRAQFLGNFHDNDRAYMNFKYSF